MMKKDTILKDKKPSPFRAPGFKELASKEEIEKRLTRIKRAKEIGQDLTRVDSKNCEIENPYRVQALLYIMQDKEVPQELKDKIKKFDEQNNYKIRNITT